MPTSDDLMGLGMPSLTASQLGNNPLSVAGAGTTQATATAIKGGSHLVQVTASASNTGAILPTAPIGTPFWIASLGGTAAKIYCPVGHTLNGTLNGGATFSAVGLLVFIQTSRGVWSVLGTATSTVA